MGEQMIHSSLDTGIPASVVGLRSSLALVKPPLMYGMAHIGRSLLIRGVCLSTRGALGLLRALCRPATLSVRHPISAPES
jgi:hypothetical protein